MEYAKGNLKQRSQIKRQMSGIKPSSVRMPEDSHRIKHQD